MTAPTTDPTTPPVGDPTPTPTPPAPAPPAPAPTPSTGSKATIGELLQTYGVSDADRALVLGQVERANSEAARYRTQRNELRTQVATLDTLKAERDTAVAEVSKTRGNLVESEVKRYAADRFADERDALASIAADKIGEFLTPDGGVDGTKIATHLDGILTDRPHWAKPTGKTGPKPLPNQGQSGGGGSTPEQLAAAALKDGNTAAALTLKSDQLLGLMRQTPSS